MPCGKRHTYDSIIMSSDLIKAVALARKDKGKYQLGCRTELKEHNKNGKVAFTTTLTKENYIWLKKHSAATKTSGSEILNTLIEAFRSGK